MEVQKIEALLGMKNIQRLPNTPHHQHYNLLEHSFIVGVLFKWFADEENVQYDVNTLETVLLHDFMESVTGDLNYCVKNLTPMTVNAWNKIEDEIAQRYNFLKRYTDNELHSYLNITQYNLLKCCDYLDLWLFCVKEIELGNHSKGIKECCSNCLQLIYKHADGCNGVDKFISVIDIIDNYGE